MSTIRQRVVVVGGDTRPSRELEAVADRLTARNRREAVEQVESGAIDCVVVDETATEPFETVAAVRSVAPQVPIIYVTARADGTAAAAATRAGATEYYHYYHGTETEEVTEPGTDDGTAAETNDGAAAKTNKQTLADRVAAVTDESTPVPKHESPATATAPTTTAPTDEATSAHRAAVLERLHGIISDDTLEFERRLEQVLSVSRSILGVEYGTLSRIEGDRYEFRYVAGVDDAITAGQTLPLSEAYCERIAATETSLSFDSVDTDRPDLRDRSAYHDLGIRCFLGAPVSVDGELWGSLCFFARDDRDDGFTGWDRTVVELLADWAGHELEHRHRRQQLEDARASLEQTLDRVDDAFFALDEDWQFTSLNERAKALIVPDDRDLLGTSVWDAFPDAVGTSFETQCRHAMAEQEPVSFEAFFPPLSTWFQVRTSSSETGLSVYFTDISERRARETELQRYETIIETIDDGVVVIDADQRVARVNEAYATLVGEDRTALPGNHASTLLDEDSWSEWMSSILSLSAGDSSHATLETELKHADGTAVPVEANVTSLPDDEPHDTGYVCVVRDVTERKHREEIVTQLLETTRRLFACENRTAVAETIADATERTFGYPFVGVRLYDADSESLTLAAASDRVDDLGAREPIPVGSGPVGTAFARAEPLLLADVRRDEYEFVHENNGKLQSLLCIPIGDLGVLSVGSPDADAFGESDRQLAQLLTESAALALERADRRETLIRHEQVLESVEGMVYALDPNGRFILVTEPLADRAGYDRETLLGEHVSTVLEQESVDRGRRRIRELLADDHRNSTSYEAAGVTADGERFPIEIECSLLPTADGFGGTVGAVRDITQRKEREQYLQVLTRVLRHNLRNDLTVIIGYAELLLEELEDDDLVSTTATLHETATDLVRTSEKAQAIQYALDRDSDPEPVDVVAVVETTVDGLELGDATVRVSTPNSCWARADEALSLVVENLLENAVRHTTTSPTVAVSVTVDADRVILSVADDGPGIPDGEVDVVTGDSTITQLSHSSGLGLWLVRWIVDAYDGTVSFDEGPLGGSQVTVALPRVRPDDER